MNQPAYRLRELDFLRGLAIILVLFRHSFLFQFTKNLGWIGVDLFFVLSGFLVSGLLFKEYQKFGNIRPGRFLIRRGFKIYPVYYTFYLFYLIPLVVTNGINWKGFIADMFFVQNYVVTWGYAFGASWSLAVEEHFYFGLVLVMWFCLKNWPPVSGNKGGYFNDYRVEIIILPMMAFCLIIRIASNLVFPLQTGRHFTMTHLRIDSLLSGVLVSYLYYFKNGFLQTIYKKFKWHLFLAVPLLLSFTPFIDPLPSFFVKTTGFTLLYIASGSVLIIFLMKKNINDSLDRVFSKTAVDAASRIGFCSYSIYIIHLFIIGATGKLKLENHYLNFLISSTGSILAGMLMTFYFEKYFLKIRDTYFPARSVQ